MRRIYVEKPGKSVLRPLGIPSSKHRIVQELIRGVLTVIYEPTFMRENHNFGFRPKLSTLDARTKLEKKGRGMTFAIEGDIKGAYENVDHDILLNILRKRIKDIKLIKFIQNLLKSGLEFQGRYQHTLLGVPQGGIVSPPSLEYLHARV